jgi:hypothetical protein
MTTCDHFLDAVLAPASAQLQHQALIGFLEGAYLAAEALPDPAARPQAHMQHMLQASHFIAALTTPQALARMAAPAGPACSTHAAPAVPAHNEDPLAPMRQQLLLVQSGGEHVLALLQKVRQQYHHRVARRDYRDELCGAYPLRDTAHEELHVASAAQHSATTATGRQYPFAAVTPYTSPHGTRAARAALYQQRMQVRTLTAEDLKSPAEQALIGQRGVFAAARIPAGTCLGVYGGQVMDPVDIFILQDDRYLIGASAQPGLLGINGENVLAMANTLFLLDAQGKPAGHPPTGYNMEAAAFPARLADGREIVLHAFFATADVAAGEELRWNYGLGRCVPEQVALEEVH